MTRSVLTVLAACGFGCGLAQAAPLPPSTVAGSPPGFNWPMSLDAVVADPKNHREIYRDDHVSVLEVTLWPHDQEKMHGHPYPSVFAVDDVFPRMTNVGMGKGPPVFGPIYATAGAPAYPHCMTLGPQNPHAATIQEAYPQHFYRIQFKKLDPAGFAENWRTTYPDLGNPASVPQTDNATAGPAFSQAWPYAIGYESTHAAPANYRVLFSNGKMRLLEVTIAPGATEPMNGTPYYSVNAFDSGQPGAEGGAKIIDRQLDPQSPLIGKMLLGGGKIPTGLDGPSCTVTGPIPPHQVTNLDRFPVHYYRFEFLRVDGEGFAANWKTWYPEMAEGPQPQRVKK